MRHVRAVNYVYRSTWLDRPTLLLCLPFGSSRTEKWRRPTADEYGRGARAPPRRRARPRPAQQASARGLRLSIRATPFDGKYQRTFLVACTIEHAPTRPCPVVNPLPLCSCAPSLCCMVSSDSKSRFRTRPCFAYLVPNAATKAPSPDEEVYLCLLRVYLQTPQDAGHPATKTPGSPPALKTSDGSGAAGGGEGEVGGLDEAISLLERHFSRVDPVQVMTLLPPDVPVSKLLPFLSSAVRHAEAKRRNNQVHAGVGASCVAGGSGREKDRRVPIFRVLRRWVPSSSSLCFRPAAS